MKIANWLLTAKEAARLRARVADLEAQLGWSERVKEMVDRPQFQEELKGCFGGVTLEHPAVKGALMLLSHQLRLEHGEAKAPGIDERLREYRTGREAALEDFLVSLTRAVTLPKKREEREG